MARHRPLGLTVAFATDKVSVYAIETGRGFEQAAKVLGKDFAGIVVRDGQAPSPLFRQVGHQTCLQHPLCRYRENLETADRAPSICTERTSAAWAPGVTIARSRVSACGSAHSTAPDPRYFRM